MSSMVRRGFGKRLPIANYFQDEIVDGMKVEMQLFKGLSVLNFGEAMSDAEMFLRLGLLVAREEFFERSGEHRRLLYGLKGFDETFKSNLVGEMAGVCALRPGIQQVLVVTPQAKQPALLWEFWFAQRAAFPSWYRLASLAALVLTSSALCERLFSVLRGNTSEQQSSECAATFEARDMCLSDDGMLFDDVAQ